MLYVKTANLADAEKEWLFVRDMPYGTRSPDNSVITGFPAGDRQQANTGRPYSGIELTMTGGNLCTP